MGTQQDIAKIIEQEQGIIFDSFDEESAFAIGSAIREAARADGVSLVVDIRLWDRPLFFSALPGTTGDNAEWVRRKANVVKRFHKSTYRMVLEKSFPDVIFPAHRALDAEDFVLAGGGFPIKVRGIGVVGAVVVSGLPERQDHERVVVALCAHLGLDGAALALVE